MGGRACLWGACPTLAKPFDKCGARANVLTFLNMEAHHMLAASNLYDPRFKKLGFVDMGAAEQCTWRLTDEAGEAPDGMEETSEAT